MAQQQVRLDEDVQQLVAWLVEREAKEGRPGMSDKRALNWLAREGARAMKLATPVATVVRK